MPISFNGSTSKLVWSGDIGASQYPCTLFCWVKHATSATSGAVCGFGSTSNGNYEEMIFSSGTKVRVYYRTSSGASSYADSTTAEQTTWQPAMAVYETATSRKIYYSSGAVVADTASAGSAVAPDRFVVGTRPTSDSLYFAGEIAEVAVWSSALTQGDFDSMAAGAKPETISAGTLLECWPLETTSDLAGTVSRTLTATSVSAGGTHPIDRSVPAPTFTGTIPTLTGTEGVALAAQSPTIASYFSGAGITYTVSTALPAGLSINSGTGVISGTPSTGDDWSGYVTATNGGGSDDSNTFPITISAASSPVAFSGTVPAQSGTVGTAYTTLALASYFTGSFTPYTYSVFSGALPGGLSLNTSTGEITGTPTTAGSFSAVVRATDTATNTANTGTISWTILAAMATTASVTLTTDGTTPAASLTGLKWAYWDVLTPDLMTTAPLVKGSAETTDGSGVLTVTITGTTKRVGEVGYLLVTNSDGTTTQGAALRAFAAPVAVS